MNDIKFYPTQGRSLLQKFLKIFKYFCEIFYCYLTKKLLNPPDKHFLNPFLIKQWRKNVNLSQSLFSFSGRNDNLSPWISS